MKDDRDAVGGLLDVEFDQIVVVMSGRTNGRE